MRHKAAQNALSVVSYIFLFVGLVALIEMAHHAFLGLFHFNFGIFGIGIFTGLRRYSRIWRACALVFTWYGMVTGSIALYICLHGDSAPTNPILYSRRLASVPGNWLAFPLLMVLLVTFWQYRVLTHPAVKRLFREDPRPVLLPEPRSVDAGVDGAVIK